MKDRFLAPWTCSYVNLKRFKIYRFLMRSFRSFETNRCRLLDWWGLDSPFPILPSVWSCRHVNLRSWVWPRVLVNPPYPSVSVHLVRLKTYSAVHVGHLFPGSCFCCKRKSQGWSLFSFWFLLLDADRVTTLSWVLLPALKLVRLHWRRNSNAMNGICWTTLTHFDGNQTWSVDITKLKPTSYLEQQQQKNPPCWA